MLLPECQVLLLPVPLLVPDLQAPEVLMPVPLLVPDLHALEVLLPVPLLSPKVQVLPMPMPLLLLRNMPLLLLLLPQWCHLQSVTH